MSVVAIGLGVGLGVFFGTKKSTNSSAQSLTVSGLSSDTSITLARRSLQKRSTLSDAFVSSSGYNFAEVVNLKLYLKSVDFVPANSADQVATTNPGGSGSSTEIIIGPTGNVNLTGTIDIPATTYTKAQVRLINRYAVKAFCKTANNLVYTSATGIQKVALTNTMPSDFDYYAYKFLWPGITSSTTVEQTNESSFDTDVAVTVNSTSNVAILFETAYTITCYDGTYSTSNDVNNNAVMPFGDVPANGQYLARSQIYPFGNANMAVIGIPAFAYLGTSAALVRSQTFLASQVQNKLTTNFEPKSLYIFTIAFTSTGAFLGAKGHNYDNGLSAGGLAGMFILISEDISAHTVTLYGCEFYATTQTKVKNRKLVNFPTDRVVSATPFQLDTSDGDDCNGSFNENGQNRAFPCIGGTFSMSGVTALATVYWRRVK